MPTIGKSEVLTFRDDVPLAQTMVFEDVYEAALRMDMAEKAGIVRAGIVTWMFVDGAIAGETYGLASSTAGEDIEDLEPDPAVLYCYSTTLLPQFQKRGLSKILVAYWLGRVKQAGFREVAGHATSPAMTSVKAAFGATFTALHPGWYGTTRTAHFYRLPL